MSFFSRQAQTLEAFAPQIIQFFNVYAERFEAEFKRRIQEQEKNLKALVAEEEQKPRYKLKPLDGNTAEIISIIPSNGDQNVDPGLRAIVVVFDRQMKNGSWSFGRAKKNLPSPTVLGEGAYDSMCNIWVQPIQLESDKVYSFTLNQFKTADGVAMPSVKISFKTAKRGDSNHGDSDAKAAK